MQNVSALISFGALIFYSVLMLIVLRRDIRSRIYRFFGLYLSSMIIWSFGSLMIFAGLVGGPLFWNRFMVVGSIGMPIAFFAFVEAFLRRKNNFWPRVGLASYIFVQAANLFGYVVKDAYVLDGLVYNEYGPAIHVTSVSWAFFIGYSAVDLIREYISTKDTLYRNRLRYLLLVVIVIFTGSLTNITHLSNYPVDIAFNAISALLIAYAIFRHQLLDINVVVRKGLLYSVPTIIIGAGYFLVIYAAMQIFHAVTGFQLAALSLIVALLTALVAEPLRNRVQYWVDKHFFRERYDAGLMLRRLSSTAASLLDLDRLAGLILDEIAANMHISKAAFLLKAEKGDDLRVAVKRGLEVPESFAMPPDHPLVFWLATHDRALTMHDMDVVPQFKSLWEEEREQLEALGAELFVPLRAKDDLVGILVMGPKLSEQPYTEDDILVLTTLASQTAMAIDNARLYRAAQQELLERRRAEDELRRSHKAQAEINRILRLSLGDMPLDQLLSGALSAILSVLQPAFEPMGSIYLADEESGTLTVRASSGYDRWKPLSCARISLGECICGKAALAQEIRFVDPLSGHYECRAAREEPHGHCCVPILFAGKTLGIINLYPTAGHRPDVQEEEFLSAVANALAGIIMRRQVEEERESIQAQLLQAQKMEAVGRLAGGVAHDFNNLLTAIISYSEFLIAALDPEDPRRADAEQIKQVAARAAALTRQLLAFSRRQALQPTETNLNDIVLGIQKMLRRLIGEDIELVTVLGPGVKPIKADPGQIEQVIMNLAVNARDAMSNGGTLSIKTENVLVDADQCRFMPEARPGYFVRLSIEDTGIGMDEEVMQHLFEPFFTTKEVGKGTGLGLAVVYGIVKQHNGWINVYSEPGHGSTFRVYLPACVEEGEILPETLYEFVQEELRGDGARVLLVEDERDVRAAVRRTLDENGYIVFEAADASEAVTIYNKEKGRFDLLFSDVVLPGQNGIQLAEELAARNKRLRVLLSSGYTGERARWSIIQERGFHFLQKPFGSPDLLRAIKETLQARFTPLSE